MLSMNCSSLRFNLLSFSSPILSPSLLPTSDASGSSAQPGSPAYPSSPLIATSGSAWAMKLARANKMDGFWPWVIAGGSSWLGNSSSMYGSSSRQANGLPKETWKCEERRSFQRRRYECISDIWWRSCYGFGEDTAL